MNCLIIDDEKLIRELLEDNVKSVPYLHLIKSCKDSFEAMEVLRKQQIDLLLLDIQMPRLDGLQLIKSLVHPPMVILITAFEKYALEGFNLQVVDYILKPFSYERFLKACNRAYELFLLKSKNLHNTDPTAYFFVNVEYKQVKIQVDDITYIEGLKDYIKIHLSSTSKPVLTRMSMKVMEEKLSPNTLIRTHKSYLVAISKITMIKRDLVCIADQEIPVSEFYRGNLDRMINSTKT